MGDKTILLRALRAQPQGKRQAILLPTGGASMSEKAKWAISALLMVTLPLWLIPVGIVLMVWGVKDAIWPKGWDQ